MEEYEPRELWNLCLKKASVLLDRTEFESWLKNSVYEDLSGSKLIIRFRNSFVAGHVKSRFGKNAGGSSSRYIRKT